MAYGQGDFAFLKFPALKNQAILVTPNPNFVDEVVPGQADCEATENPALKDRSIFLNFHPTDPSKVAPGQGDCFCSENAALKGRSILDPPQPHFILSIGFFSRRLRPLCAFRHQGSIDW